MDYLVLIAILLGGVALAIFFASRCPSCKRPLALRFTDNYRDAEKMGVKVKQREVVCRRCGHRSWRDQKEPPAGPGD